MLGGLFIFYIINGLEGCLDVDSALCIVSLATDARESQSYLRGRSPSLGKTESRVGGGWVVGERASAKDGEARLLPPSPYSHPPLLLSVRTSGARVGTRCSRALLYTRCSLS